MKLSKVLFMAKRLYTDLYDHTDMNLCFDNGPELKEYYIVFEEKDINTRGGNKPFKFDKNGVPLLHSYIDVVDDAGYYYYPITIGQYALAIYHTYLKTNSTEKKEHFLRIADWFVYTAIHDDRLGAYWLTDVPKPEFNMYEPWKSAFAQSRGISVCLRAYQMTGDIKYEDLATLALKPFLYQNTEGGVATCLNKNKSFYEEYATLYSTRVLPGHMFSLLGISDYLRAGKTDIETASEIFNQGIETLIKVWPLYKTNNWLKYNLPQNRTFVDPCTMGYMRLIQNLVQIIKNISEEKEMEILYSDVNQMINYFNLFKSYYYKYKALKKLNRL